MLMLEELTIRYGAGKEGESLFLDYYRGDGTALLLDDLLAPVWFIQTDIEVHACGWGVWNAP